MKRTLFLTAVALIFLWNGKILTAQSALALSSATATAGSPVTLDLTVTSPTGSVPAGLQWTYTYSASSVSSFVVTAGPALSAAGKTLNCLAGSTGYTCVAAGTNGNVISNGIVAKAAVTLKTGVTSASIGVTGGLGAAIDGSALSLSTTGGTITSGPIVPSLSTLVCNPASLAPNAAAVCTVSMTAPVTANASVALASTGSLTVPATVSIAAGAATATFNATAGSFSANQAATVTGTLNGVTATANLSLVAKISLTSMACTTTVLAPAGTTSCTVTLSSPAPAGGSTVTLASSLTSAITVPASVLVPANATTANFTATALNTIQSSTLTASFNGSSKNLVLSVAAATSISSLTCNATLSALGVGSCTVTLSQAAASGGATVTLASSLVTALTVPASILVPAAATTATFPATALAVLTNQSATVTATLNGSSKTAVISITTGNTLSSVTCVSTTLNSSTGTSCTVTLSQAAPTGGSTIALTSSVPALLTVPANVVVPASVKTVTFTAVAGAATSSQSSIITASFAGSTKTVTISVTPSIMVSALTCAKTSMIAPTTTTCTVTLSQAAPSAGSAVALASSKTTALTVPASVQVPAAATSATFTATAPTVVTANQTADLTATLNGGSKTVTLAISVPMSVTSLSCTSVSLLPNTSTTCNVTISSIAPSGGITVRLASSIPTALSVPASVVVPANATSVTFTAAAANISTNQSPILTATQGTSSVTLPVAINGLMSLTSLNCGATVLAASGSTVCTVTTSKAAPASGTTVTLTSTLSSAMTIPATVLVPAGATSATFTATAAAVTADQNLTIMAAITGSIQSLAMSISIPVNVTALQCTGSTLTSLMTTTCTVTLAKAAPAIGSPVTIATGVNNVLSVPASVVVPAGAASANFSVTARTVHATTTTTLRAVSGSSAVSITIALSPDPSAITQFSCTPLSVAPGDGGTCTVTMTAAVPSIYTVTVRSTNSSLVVPASVNVPANSATVSFPFTTSNALAGWAIVSATRNGISKTAVIQTDLSSAATAQSVLACDQRYVPAGGSTLCEIRAASESTGLPAEITISSSSDNVKVPAIIRPRAGAGSTRFEVWADEQARQQNVVIEAKSSAGKAQESLAVLSSGAPLLRLPGTRSARSGSRVAFQVSALDSQELPVAVSGKGLPRGASLDPATGDFTWTPGEADLGTVDLLFSATDAAGMTTTGTVRVNVVSRPIISGLRNGAGTGAIASCSPGARMTLLGTFFTDDQRGGGPLSSRIGVKANGETVAVTAASQAEVDFLCPVLDPGTSFTLTVDVAGRISEEFRSTMVESAPGLFAVTGSPRSQGLVMHSRGLAAIPRFDVDGTPALPGETVRFYATGLNCENSHQNSTLLYFGKGYQPIASIVPSSYAGLCEVSAVVPEGVFGQRVELFLEVLRSDATLLRSNTISLAIDEPIAEH